MCSVCGLVFYSIDDKLEYKPDDIYLPLNKYLICGLKQTFSLLPNKNHPKLIITIKIYTKYGKIIKNIKFLLFS